MFKTIYQHTAVNPLHGLVSVLDFILYLSISSTLIFFFFFFTSESNFFLLLIFRWTQETRRWRRRAIGRERRRGAAHRWNGPPHAGRPRQTGGHHRRIVWVQGEAGLIVWRERYRAYWTFIILAMQVFYILSNYKQDKSINPQQHRRKLRRTGYCPVLKAVYFTVAGKNRCKYWPKNLVHAGFNCGIIMYTIAVPPPQGLLRQAWM